MTEIQETDQDSGVWLAAAGWLVLLVVCTPAVLVAVAGRLVARLKDWGWGVLAAAAGGAAMVVLAAGWVAEGSVYGAVYWHVEAVVSLGRHFGSQVGWGVAPTGSVAGSVGWMVPLSIPVGLAAASVWSGVAEFHASEELQFERDEVLAVVPLTGGERRVAARTAARMTAGAFTHEGGVRRGPFGRAPVPGTVGMGTGLGGRPVTADVAGFLRPLFVQGVPGSGKTAETNSLGGQLIALGSGWVVVDFKGGRDVAEHYFEVAQAHGRRFLHFDLADPSGVAYTPVGPGAPSSPAFYDPLVRGNATSKADMLLNSVGRDGDAAVYFRSAYDYAQLAYLVADWSGYSRGKGGLECLVDLLDIEFLQKVADGIDLDAVASRVPPAQQVAARRAVHEVRERVSVLVSNWRRDELTRSAVADTQRLISTYANGPAAGQWLRPGPVEQTIDLRRAAHEGDVVVFSLNVSTYGSLARTIGTLVLLDMQNTTDMLRRDIAAGYGHQWPLYVQIEEFGSASGDAVLGLCNKARDAGVRPILSTQSWADLVAVDGTGVWARRVLETCGNFLCLRVNGDQDAGVLSGLTSQVTKVYARVQHQLDRHGRRRTKHGGLVQRDQRREPRVPASVFQDLPDHHMVWVTKHPTLATVHTVDEGPNRWWEAVHTVLVDATVLPSVRPAVVEWRPDGTWGRPGEVPVALVKAPLPSAPSGMAGPAHPVPPGHPAGSAPGVVPSAPERHELWQGTDPWGSSTATTPYAPHPSAPASAPAPGPGPVADEQDTERLTTVHQPPPSPPTSPPPVEGPEAGPDGDWPDVLSPFD
ncbi:type IV secretory system conjugative DNA transfer family protein [Streptomyces sp. NPDC058268]|uniref:type IV secretory system conjugative DNA transfer family protein n=1 Tax=Streptomyces sp. NPDC058268 TaxID=3346413 RepID=UPI0036E354E3